jgi:hypothetical protein
MDAEARRVKRRRKVTYDVIAIAFREANEYSNFIIKLPAFCD